MDRTDDEVEKYPVCPQRNTPAAFRWFYPPSRVLAFFRRRQAPRPAAALAPEAVPARKRA